MQFLQESTLKFLIDTVFVWEILPGIIWVRHGKQVGSCSRDTIQIRGNSWSTLRTLKRQYRLPCYISLTEQSLFSCIWEVRRFPPWFGPSTSIPCPELLDQLSLTTPLVLYAGLLSSFLAGTWAHKTCICHREQSRLLDYMIHPVPHWTK